MNTYSNEIFLEKGIYNALKFYDMFDYPLTLIEVYKFLQNYEGKLEGQSFELSEIDETISQMPEVKSINGFYMLREELYEARFARHNTAHKRWKKALKLIGWISDVPFLKLVAMCNMFPIDTPKPESDIDIVIVAKHGRIWFVRLIVTLLIAMTGQWRHKKIAGKLCLSFFMSDEHLDMQKLYKEKNIWLDNDPYLYNWLAVATPIYDRDDTAQKFFTANAWVKKYIPQSFTYDPVDLRRVKRSLIARGWQNFWEFVLAGKFGDFVEKAVRKLQSEYMKARGDQEWLRNPNVVRSDEVLKFHEVDRREEFASTLDT